MIQKSELTAGDTVSRPARKPRILVLTSTFPRWRDDTEPSFVLDLCRRLAAVADIHVLAPHAQGAMREEIIDGIRVVRYRYFIPGLQNLAYEGGILARIRDKPLRALQLPLFAIALWWSALRKLHTWKPDLIHAHWVVPQGLIACLIGGGRVPVLCTSHGGDLHGLKSPVMLWLKAWTLRHCRRVTVVSANLLEQVRQLAPDVAVDIAAMGTDLTTQFVLPLVPDVRRRNEIVFVGRLVENKGLRFLLEAFANLAQRHTHPVLTIIGDGPLRYELTERARRLEIGHRVRFIGALQHSQLPVHYQRATIAAFPFAEQQGFGLVAVEAMGCGCPIIASDVPAIREIVTSEVSGLLVPPKDAIALAAGIERLLMDPALRDKFSRNALNSVRQRFDWSHVARSYSEIIGWEIARNNGRGNAA